MRFLLAAASDGLAVAWLSVDRACCLGASDVCLDACCTLFCDCVLACFAVVFSDFVPECCWVKVFKGVLAAVAAGVCTMFYVRCIFCFSANTHQKKRGLTDLVIDRFFELCSQR